MRQQVLSINNPNAPVLFKGWLVLVLVVAKVLVEAKLWRDVVCEVSCPVVVGKEPCELAPACPWNVGRGAPL